MIWNKSMLITTIAFLLLACDSQINTTNSEEKTSHQDVPFVQEYHIGYVIDKANDDANDVRAVVVNDEGMILAATKDGVYSKNEASDWKLMISGEAQGPTYDVAFDNKGIAWVAAWDGVYTNKSGSFTKIEGPVGPVAKILSADEGVYSLGPKGIWLFEDFVGTKKDFTKARSIRAAISDGNQGLWLGTDVGLYHCNEEETTLFNENEDLLSAYVRGIDFDHKGNLWVGGLGGVTVRSGERVIEMKRPADGIPHGEVTVVSRAPDATMWVGTQHGITRFKPGQDDYSVRHTRRWLMSDEVRDIFFDKEGAAWIATSKGVSAIGRREMTLAEKADFFYEQMITRHVREPWIVGRFRLEVPGDTATLVPDDDDNDGEYTALYLATECFRYAVTGSEEAKERAKKAFDFLHYLREVTEIDGFFARTIVPSDWDDLHDANRTYTPQQLGEELIKNPRHKPVEVRWHLSSDGRWKWKGDTSSDEMVGHFYGYYWYYMLVADGDEKKRIANHVSVILDHLIKNNFNLIGADGTHTKWGVWSPQNLNQDPEWSPERALNSLEMLSFLKFGYAITGDEKYQESYIHLIENEGYIENAKKLYVTNPAWETYFDIYLALYIYPALINLESEPELKKFYKQHMDQWFEKFKKTKSALLNFSYNLLAGGSDELETSIFFLQDAPLDLVDWYIDNSQREDLQLARYPILEEIQVSELRPPSEYRTIRWDKNPYYAVAGNPYQEREPVYWLLPYWIGRYQELIK